ncbi:hypothetical protein MKY59_21075 [Paenibacillus sp. FSL W8-0426]|uniref:hypothetical protein n=1 Tax=Paenibacillus sp. FSL W8-0426 TaxID=2921714 RepID=UPI0030D9EDBD
MIRQEKRKRRWLDKNGFTFVTAENEHILEGLGMLYKKPWLLKENRLPVYAFKEIQLYDVYDKAFRKSIFVVSETKMERDQLHEIKLEYIRCTTDPNERKRVRKGILRWWKDIKAQWLALFKHGVNPWW